MTNLGQRGCPTPAAQAQRRSRKSALVDGAKAKRLPKVEGGPWLWFVITLWFIVLCSPQWLIASFGAKFALAVPTFLFAILLALVALHWPRHWNVPLLSLFLYTTITLLLAYNRGRALVPTKQLLLYYVLTVGTLTLVRRPRQALPIILLYFLGQYVWWIGFGVKSGSVEWDSWLANQDSFGPQMVLAIPACAYFGLAVKDRRLKWLAFASAGGAVLGLVSAFARGAVFSGVAVALFLWLRAPARNKGAIALGLVVALGLVAMGAKVISGEGRGTTTNNFWAEMSSAFSETKESSGTAGDREVLWRLARRVFYENPLLGVGADNFGPYAAEHFAAGTVGGEYDENPSRLYDRALHSTYFQVLCEYGALGSLIFIWLLVDFWIKNRRLRSPGFNITFDAAMGGTLSLKHLALGLEASMVGFLASGAFYNQLFIHWLYTIIGVNLLLHEISRSRADGLAPIRMRR